MKLKLFPTPMASKDNKKKWLVYELVRYRDFIRRYHTLKLMLIYAFTLGAITLLGSGWPVCVGVVIGLVVFDFHYEMLVFWQSKDFLMDIGEACFDIESVTDHDFRVLMNRVENYVKTKDAAKKEMLYRSLEECYDGMKFKVDIKEAIDDLKKGKEQEKAEG